MTLQDAIEAFLSTKPNPETRRDYARVGRLLTAQIGGDRPLQDITPADLRQLVDALRARRQRYAHHPTIPAKSGGLAPETLNTIIRHTKALLTWCAAEGMIDKSPARYLRLTPIRAFTRSKAIPPEDLATMIRRVRTAGGWTGARNLALILFLADTGCRRGGAASLTIENLDLEAREALLIEKGGQPHRVYFGHETADGLAAWLALRPGANHSYVFVRARLDLQPMTPEAIGQIVRKLAIKATGHSYGPHAIRHRVGQAWADSGRPATLVAQKLGHRTIAVTLAHYYNQDPARLRRASDDLALAALKA